MLVELSLTGGPQGTTWKAEGTTLTGKGGAALNVVSVWQESTRTSKGNRWVLVEAEADEDMPLEAWTLRLRGEGPGGDLILEDIGFARLVRAEDGG